MTRHAVLFLILGPMVLSAAEPKPEPTERGKALLDDYLRDQTERIASGSLTGFDTRDQWEKARPEMRRQFLDMMGLWPLPEKTPLNAVTTGTTDGEGYTIERVHFQSRPGLYVTGNLYVPKPAPEKAPGVLYVCGHSQVKEKGVAYGSKVAYQRHGSLFARHGYVCLIVDTLQLGEIEGIHHGTYREGMWWWQSIGYTPAGVECWNGVRALDYLQSRPEVDPERLGVTGRSGGGASSWWIAAADDRVKCVVPVAGIADLYAHVVEGELPPYQTGVIAGHCDCMFMVNTHRWDFDAVAALCAPRPTLLGNSDRDTIFPVGGYRRLAEKVQKIYTLYDADDRFQLMETEGPHVDTPELRLGALRWMDRWLKDQRKPVEDVPERLHEKEELRVFEGIPKDAINTEVHNTFVDAGDVGLPPAGETAGEQWDARAEGLKETLRRHTFGGWPEQPPALAPKPAGEHTADGLTLRAFDFVSEDQVPLRLWLLTAATDERPKLVVLNVLDEAGWAEWCRELGPDFGDLLQAGDGLTRDDEAAGRTRQALERFGWAYAAVAPRGVGPTLWAEPGSREDIQIRRRFALLGQTVDGQRVWDARRAVAALGELDTIKDVPLWLQAKRDMAGVAVYAALFEPSVKRLDLWELPASHRQGPTLLNVLRHLDMPQALGLLRGRQVKLYVSDESDQRHWMWTKSLHERLGSDDFQIRVVPAAGPGS